MVEYWQWLENRKGDMAMAKLTGKIQLNKKWYYTDRETQRLFASILPQAIETGDFSAAWAILDLGLASGRIVEEKCFPTKPEPFTAEAQSFRDALK